LGGVSCTSATTCTAVGAYQANLVNGDNISDYIMLFGTFGPLADRYS
jgi:hypothetical protein